MRRRLWILAALVLAAGVGHAQVWRGGFGFYAAPKHPAATTFGHGFNHCRLMFSSDHHEKRGWSTGDPDYITVAATEPARFQCPYVLVEDGGSARFTDEEVLKLREYLLKGGFLFASDAYAVGIDIVLYAMTH